MVIDLITKSIVLFTQQLSVKEFYLKIIPWRLFTFRVCPGTKVSWNRSVLILFLDLKSC